MVAEQESGSGHSMVKKIIAIASGKGGVGEINCSRKSCLCSGERKEGQ